MLVGWKNEEKLLIAAFLTRTTDDVINILGRVLMMTRDGSA